MAAHMRLTLLIAVALLATLTAAPPAAADHMGPCTHQWIEIPLTAVLGYKNGAKWMVSTTSGGASSCANGTITYVCDGCISLGPLP